MKRRATAAVSGYRSLTRTELQALGLSTKSRRYTRSAPGKPISKTFSRRAIEQRVTGSSFESAANARAIATQGRSRLSLTISGERLEEGSTSRYDWYLRAWAETHDQTIGQARNDPERRRNYEAIVNARNASRKSYANRPGGPYAKALEAIDLREHGATYKVGDTPKYGK